MQAIARNAPVPPAAACCAARQREGVNGRTITRGQACGAGLVREADDEAREERRRPVSVEKYESKTNNNNQQRNNKYRTSPAPAQHLHQHNRRRRRRFALSARPPSPHPPSLPPSPPSLTASFQPVKNLCTRHQVQGEDGESRSRCTPAGHGAFWRRGRQKCSSPTTSTFYTPARRRVDVKMKYQQRRQQQQQQQKTSLRHHNRQHIEPLHTVYRTYSMYRLWCGSMSLTGLSAK